jgi:hypothetical protein
MGSTMHRLHICVEEHQYRYLAQRAKREGVSVAALVRRMVQQEAEATQPGGFDELLAIAGIGEDNAALEGGLPVSEGPHGRP